MHLHILGSVYTDTDTHTHAYIYIRIFNAHLSSSSAWEDLLVATPQ